MSAIGNWLRGLRTENISTKDTNVSTNSTNSADTERPQKTEMPSASLGRDLVTNPVKKTSELSEENKTLLTFAKLFVCQRQKDVDTIRNVLENNPGIVDKLSQAKDSEGNPLFNHAELCSIILNCKNIIQKHPDRIDAVLNNPEEINNIASDGGKEVAFYRAVNDPLNSTVALNPDAFKKCDEKTPYSEFLKKPSFPKKFDKEEYERWAEESGLKIENDMFGYKMLNNDGQIVRTTWVNYQNGDITSDKILEYTEDGRKKAQYIKSGMNKNIDVCLFDSKESITTIAQITPQGQWISFDGTLLETNPLTGEKQ